jgi:hypothetical protein
MKRLGVLIVAAGAAALIPLAAAVQTGPTRVGSAGAGTDPQLESIQYGGPAEPPPMAAAYGPPNYVATPEIVSRVGEIIGAIDSPQKRSELAEQWLRYSKEIINQDMEYRRQWLDLQRAQLSQFREVEQLRMEVARLQAQLEELRARNAQLERESLRMPAQLGPGPGGSSSAPAPQAPALK